MHLCVNLHLLRSGDQDAYAFFIDTEGSCFMDRFEQMANTVSQRSGMDLSSIRVIRILDYDELEELLKALPNVVGSEESARSILFSVSIKGQKVCFVAFDSLALYFRYRFADMGLKSRAMHDAAKVLHSLACEDDIAIGI
ncbi:hypothetical protein BC829DRAFT_151342 [Chytridium lagenaria]|nr:hypothetical protein BC829DRAFT_151342 [Chytridium lagenaria]